LTIKNKAIVTAYYDFKLNKNSNSSYWKLIIPKEVQKYNLKLKEISEIMELRLLK